MKRAWEFLHSQQLLVPLVLAVAGLGWQFMTRRLSLEDLKNNPAYYAFPLIATFGVFAVWMTILAAKDLNHEIAEEISKGPYLFNPSGAELKPSYSHAPGWIMGAIFVSLVVAFESLALLAAYPQYHLALKTPFAPTPPEIAWAKSTPPPPAGPIIWGQGGWFEEITGGNGTLMATEYGHWYWIAPRQTIPELLINAAHRHDIPIGLLATVSYLESRLSDVTRVEANGTRSCGPLQTNEQFFPGICEAPLEEKIDRGAKFLGEILTRCEQNWTCAAHRYRFGH